MVTQSQEIKKKKTTNQVCLPEMEACMCSSFISNTYSEKNEY